MEAVMTTEWKKELPAVLGCDDAIGNDAEILIYSDDTSHDRQDLKQLSRLAFNNDMDLNDEFVKRILGIAKELRDVYYHHPDEYVHVQVRFNFNYCNM